MNQTQKRRFSGVATRYLPMTINELGPGWEGPDCSLVEITDGTLCIQSETPLEIGETFSFHVQLPDGDVFSGIAWCRGVRSSPGLAGFHLDCERLD